MTKLEKASREMCHLEKQDGCQEEETETTRIEKSYQLSPTVIYECDINE